ncbi:MAG TPA: iron-containing alcohol dehydrogenase [Acetobacteraceae bacterium]|nr:iron-containing alcohol dehydrogenase [Acetobacteraceae bacterium]
MAPIFAYPAMERVHMGGPFDEAVAAEAERAGARRVFLMLGGTISRETDWAERLERRLSRSDVALAGRWDRMAPHTPRQDVLAATRAARAANADLVVTLGGGSVTDAGKMVRMCLANGVEEEAELDPLMSVFGGARGFIPEKKAPAPPQVCVPTTLSAGDFSATAGSTDTARGMKQSFAHPRMMATAVVLDPAVTVRTPEWLFLSTGIRAVDHAIEDICSTNGNVFAEGASIHALRLLTRGLRGAKARPDDLAARLDCLLGAWMSMVGSQSGVEKGGSHGIGHALGGTAGVPHGYTSCTMLPPVLRYNLPVNADRQALVSEAMGAPGRPASELVTALVADLGLPGRLRDCGVKEEQLDAVAEAAMHDRWIPTNPRTLDLPAVRALLQEAF